MWRDDAYLLDMLLAAREIREFTQRATWERFQINRMMQHAVVRLIQIMKRAERFHQSSGRHILKSPGGKLPECATGWFTSISELCRRKSGKVFKRTCPH